MAALIISIIALLTISYRYDKVIIRSQVAVSRNKGTSLLDDGFIL